MLDTSDGVEDVKHLMCLSIRLGRCLRLGCVYSFVILSHLWWGAGPGRGTR